MKLVIAIVSNEDCSEVCSNLTKHKFFFTKLATNGGFLKIGNTTLFMGVEDEKVDELIECIKEKSRRRTEIVPNMASFDLNQFSSYPIEVQVGGATVFVLNVEKFVKA